MKWAGNVVFYISHYSQGYLIISFLILVSVSGAGKFTQCMRLQNELAVKISATKVAI